MKRTTNSMTGVSSVDWLAKNLPVELKSLGDSSREVDPLDFSKGMPSALFVSNTDSLGNKSSGHFQRRKSLKV